MLTFSILVFISAVAFIRVSSSILLTRELFEVIKELLSCCFTHIYVYGPIRLEKKTQKDSGSWAFLLN